MGWKLKALAFLFAIALIAYHAWPFAIPLFLYVFSGPILLIFNRKRRSPRNEFTQTAKVGRKPNRKRQLRNMMGGILLLIALVALLMGGRFSPYAFASLGLLVLLAGPISRSSFSSSLQAVNDSILLKRSMKPFSWVAVAEVKLLTRDVGKALIAVFERILVVASEKPSTYVTLEEFAFTRRGAEETILRRLKDLSKAVAPFGAYLLPLDGAQAVGLLTTRIEPLDVDAEDALAFLSSGCYDLVYLETVGGLATIMGAYKRSLAKKDRARAALPPSRPLPRVLPAPEVFRRLGERVEWPNPDEYTAFLTSMFATQYLPEGQRIRESVGSAGPKTVLVKSLGTPPVELSRAQLRAAVRIYSQ